MQGGVGEEIQEGLKVYKGFWVGEEILEGLKVYKGF